MKAPQKGPLTFGAVIALGLTFIAPLGKLVEFVDKTGTVVGWISMLRQHGAGSMGIAVGVLIVAGLVAVWVPHHWIIRHPKAEGAENNRPRSPWTAQGGGRVAWILLGAAFVAIGIFFIVVGFRTGSATRAASTVPTAPLATVPAPVAAPRREPSDYAMAEVTPTKPTAPRRLKKPERSQPVDPEPDASEGDLAGNTFTPPPTKISVKWVFKNKPEDDRFHTQVICEVPRTSRLDSLTIEVKTKGLMNVEIQSVKPAPSPIFEPPPAVMMLDGAYRTFRHPYGLYRVEIYSGRNDQPITVTPYPDDTFKPPAKPDAR